MNITLIFLGLFFFLNPCVALWDILPDFIGALLIIIALDKAKFVMDKAASAVKLLYVHFFISLIKTLFSFMFSSFSPSAKLLWCTVFAFADVVILIMTFSSVASVLDLAKMRYGSDATEVRSGEDTGKLVKLFGVYTVFRCVLSLLPEFTELYDSSSKDLHRYTLSSFKSMFYVIFIFFQLVFSVFVVVRFVKSFRYFKSDKEISSSVSLKYRETEKTDPVKIASVRTSFISVMFLICTVFSLSLNIDGKDVVPKIIAAVCFSLLLILIPANFKCKTVGFVMCLVLAASSVSNIFITKNYFADYTEENSVWIDSAYSLYRWIIISNIFEYISVFVLFVLTAYSAFKYIGITVEACDDESFKEQKHSALRNSKRFFYPALVVFCSVSSLVPLLRPTFGIIAMIAVMCDVIMLACVYFADFRIKHN